MTGLELKDIIRGYHIKQKDLARAIGVSEQALTSYFRTTDVRQETLDKIDNGIKLLTNNEHGVFDMENKMPAEPVTPIQQGNIIDTLGGVVKDVERELADIRLIRVELQQARDDFKSAAATLTKLINRLNQAERLDVAADENPRPK